jgi:hypothetical protein
MRPYTEELMVWDEARQRNSFETQWKLDEVRIIADDDPNADASTLVAAKLGTGKRARF